MLLRLRVANVSHPYAPLRCALNFYDSYTLEGAATNGLQT